MNLGCTHIAQKRNYLQINLLRKFTVMFMLIDGKDQRKCSLSGSLLLSVNAS